MQISGGGAPAFTQARFEVGFPNTLLFLKPSEYRKHERAKLGKMYQALFKISAHVS